MSAIWSSSTSAGPTSLSIISSHFKLLQTASQCFKNMPNLVQSSVMSLNVYMTTYICCIVISKARRHLCRIRAYKSQGRYYQLVTSLSIWWYAYTLKHSGIDYSWRWKIPGSRCMSEKPAQNDDWNVKTRSDVINWQCLVAGNMWSNDQALWTAGLYSNLGIVRLQLHLQFRVLGLEAYDLPFPLRWLSCVDSFSAYTIVKHSVLQIQL